MTFLKKHWLLILLLLVLVSAMGFVIFRCEHLHSANSGAGGSLRQANIAIAGADTVPATPTSSINLAH